MATITHAGTAVWTTTAGNKTFTGTPVLNDLIVIVAPATGVATSSITDNNADGNGTYTKIGSSFTGFSTAGDLSVWVRNALIGSATSTVFTATQTSSTGGGLDVFRVSGMSKTGSSAVRSSGGQSTGTAGTTPAPVLSNTPLTGNPIITAVCNGTSPGGVTGPTSYTAPTNLGYATPTTGMDTAFINSGITNATITWGSTSATAFASIAVELDTSGPPTSGPPLSSSIQNPAGLIVSLLRTGIAMSTLIPSAPSAPPPVPTVGPVFYPKNWPVRARIIANYPRAGVVTAENGPGTGNVSGPLNGAGFGSGMGCNGSPVRNTTTGPRFTQKNYPVQSQDPLIQQRISGIPGGRGRVYSNPGAPVTASVKPSTAPFYPKNWPVQAPDPLPRKGRIYSGPGGLVRNSTAGPPFYQRNQARPRLPLQPFLKGRVAGNGGAPVRNPSQGPPAVRFWWPVQARSPLPRRGRVYSNPGAPVNNANVIPVYGAISGPVRASLPLILRGRVSQVRQIAIPVPVIIPAVFQQLTHPVRTALPLRPFLKGRTAANGGAPVRNSTAGPVFRQKNYPVRARRPLPLHGVIRSNPGAPVNNPGPPGIGPAFRPGRTVRGQLLPAGLPNFYGRAAAMVAIPVPSNPTHGPVFRQATQPVRIRPSLPVRGRTASNPGTLTPVFVPPGVSQGQPAGIRVIHVWTGRTRSTPAYVPPAAPPPPPTSGPVVRPRSFVRGQLPAPGGANTFGRAAAMMPIPAPTPIITTSGPPFRSQNWPARIRPSLPSRGRAAFNRGAPVASAPTVGPVFRQLNHPVQARRPLPPRGRVFGNYGAPVRNSTSGAPFPAWHHPIQERIPQTWSKGRVYSNPGAPVQNPPGSGPKFVQSPRPVQARFPLPPRGRTASNPGIPVFVPTVGPKFIQRHDPARIRITQPPRGRTSFNKGAPVQNSTAGPVFRQAVRPIRKVIPQNAPRGRTWSHQGAPVQNIPQSSLLLSLGQPFTLWETGLPFTNWALDQLFTDEDLGLPFIT